MKIIRVDNFGREGPEANEKLIAESVPERYAAFIAEALVKRYGGAQSPDYFQAVPDDHVLWEFQP